LLFIFLACAAQRPPGGGPEDKESPTVVSTFPSNKETSVSIQTEITLTFSEKIKATEIEKNVFFSPPPEGDIDFSWDGTTLRIKTSEDLESDRTYVITIGTDLADLRGNSLRSSYTLAFSTGDEIDQGAVSGRVIGTDAGKASIWAFRLTEDFSDSTILSQPADYITRCGSDGRYVLSYLAAGTYRVFAVVDLDRDRLYAPSIDAVGFAAKDAVVADSSSRVKNIDFRLSMEDTTRFVLSEVAPIDLNHLSVSFSNALQSFELGGFSIADSLTGDSIRIRQAYSFPNVAGRLYFVTDTLNRNRTYRLQTPRIVNFFGDTISAETFFFSGDRKDDIRPSMRSVYPSDGQKNFRPDERIAIEFSEPPDTLSFQRGFFAEDSSGNRINGLLSWRGGVAVTFEPDGKFLSLADYRFVLQGDSIFDLFGNTLGDSAVTYQFRTANFDTLGTVTGSVVDDDSVDTEGLYFVSFRHVSTKKKVTTVVGQSKSFSVRHLFPGKYVVSSFKDRDSNQKYSFGRSIPFEFSERFTISPDTITVRKLWEVSGIRVIYPR